MSKGWQTVELRQVLKLDLNKVPVDAGTEYPMVGVYSFGHGLFTRESVSGNNTSYKFFYQLKAKHIVMSQLFGWEGALALSSEKFSGLYVSPQFPTFLCDEDKLDRNFLGWLMQRKLFWDDLGKRTKGMGDRRRTLNPDSLLSTEIPLPLLDEQRSIVEHIEAISQRTSKALSLQEEIDQSLEAFVGSYHEKYSEEKAVKLSELIYLDEEKVPIKPEDSYPQVGIRGFGKGLFAREILAGTQTTYRWFNHLYYGAIVLSQVKGWEGAIGVCDSSLVGKFVSPEYRTFRCFPNKALPEYLKALIATPYFYSRLKNLSRGVGGRRERVRPELFLELEIPMPNIERQKKAVEIYSKFSRLRELQSATGEELSALLPSVLDRAFKGEL